MANNELQFNILPSLVPFHESYAKCKSIIGPVRSGKTSSVCAHLTELASLGPESRAVIVRNTYRELKDTTQKTFFRWNPPGERGIYKEAQETFCLKGRREYPSGQGLIISEPFSMEVMFRSADRPDDIKKFKSLDLTFYWIDEAVEVDEDIKLMLDNRLSWPADYPYLCGILTSNPSDKIHWLYRQLVEDPLDDHELFRQPPYENRHNLPPGYYENLENTYINRPDWIKKYILGEWGVILEGEAFYPGFYEELHTGSFGWNRSYPMLMGWDFGARRAAVVALQIDWQTKVRTLWEHSLAGSTTGVLADQVILMRNSIFPGAIWEDWCDIAGNQKRSNSIEPDSLTDVRILKDKKIMVRFQPSPTYKVRRETIGPMLSNLIQGKPQLMVHKDCKAIIAAFQGGYRMIDPPRIPGLFVRREEPVRDGYYEHYMNALEYAIFGKIGNRIYTNVHVPGRMSAEEAQILRELHQRRV